jgi:glycosyltransferase involved in cell wall biosynthesis
MQSKVKIMFLYSSTGFGGLVNNLAKIINGLDRTQFSVFLVSLEDNNPCADLLDSDLETHVIKLACHGRLDLSLPFKIRALVKKHGIQILNADGYKADFYAILTRLLVRVKLVTILHGWVACSLKVRLYQYLDQFLFLFFDRVILLSPVQLQRHRFLNLIKYKTSVIPNGIDLLEFKGAYQSAIQDQSTPFVIGACARLAKEKDLVTLIKACAKLGSFKWKLVIVGDGEQRDFLQRVVNSEQIQDQVELVGYKSEIRPYLNSFSVFVSTSLKEGMPNALLEAAAFSLPVVLSDIPEHQYLVRGQVDGVFFKVGDSEDLSNKLTWINQNPTLSTAFGLSFHARVSAEFSLEQRKHKLEKLYLEVAC